MQPKLWPFFRLDPADETDLKWFFKLGPNPKWISPKVQRRWSQIERCLAGGGGRLRLYLENERSHTDPVFAAIIDEGDFDGVCTLWTTFHQVRLGDPMPRGFFGAVNRLLAQRGDNPPNSTYNPYAAECHRRGQDLLRDVADLSVSLLEGEYAQYRGRAAALMENSRVWQKWAPFAVVDRAVFSELCRRNDPPGGWPHVSPSTWGGVLLTNMRMAWTLAFTAGMPGGGAVTDLTVAKFLSGLRAEKLKEVSQPRTEGDDGNDDDLLETPKERLRRERRDERAELAAAAASTVDAERYGYVGHALASGTFKADITGKHTGDMLATASEIAREYGLPAETARRHLVKLGCPGATEKGKRALPIAWLHSEAGREFRSLMTRIMMAESSAKRALRGGRR